MVLVALLTALTACGSEGEAGGELSEPADVRDLTVVIADSVPLSVYSNLDDVECWAGDYQTGEASGGELPTVTVEDGEGRTLATTEAPLTGGTFTGDGCEVPVTLKGVEDADFYKVIVDAPEGGGEKSVEGGVDEILVSVD